MSNLADHIPKRILDLIRDPQFKRRFIAGLKAHPFDNPVKSQQIAEGMEINNRIVRDVARGFRLDDLPVGTDERGYYWCVKPEELDPTLEHLRARYKALGFLIARVERTQMMLRNGDIGQENLAL